MIIDLRLLFICSIVEAVLSCNAPVFIKRISFSEAVMVTKSLWVSVAQIISDVTIRITRSKKCVLIGK